ncbi:membrane protein [Companilactobacillus sp. RD055328]|uniref:ECF transporter S component n=1 Tax=Companilactobacillus sp. RD055328 TaxID=2916634 RepID=UPI002083A0AB|nr:membrane protein [Companilactobacillus sp. RD055328]
MDKSKSYKIAIRGILIAIIIVQSLVPLLGYLPLGFVNVTIIHITVIIAAIVLGPADGALIGLIWGIATVIRAATAPTSPLDPIVFVNPIISILPRILVGLFAGWTYRGLKKYSNKIFAMGAAGAVGSITNTVLVLALMRIMYEGLLASTYKVSTGALNGVLMGIVGANGIPEMIAAIILVPLIAMAILRTNKFLDK